MKKTTVISIVTYVLGLIFLPLGVALMERSDFGVSMIVAPAYVVYRFISERAAWFTFGMAEYILQAVLLIATMLILRRFRVTYLFSFVTVLIYGFILDMWMVPLQYVPTETIWVRLVLFVAGLLVSAFGVALFFHTTIPSEVYELFVKEVSTVKKVPLTKFKTAYDCCSCVAGIILSFLLFGFGNFIGIKWGTVFTAIVNGRVIGMFSKAISGITEKN